MYLQRGITGLRHIDDDPLPFCDLGEFRSICFEIAREVGYSVVRASEKSGIANFATVVFDSTDPFIAVLLNHHYPILGFAKAETDESSAELNFIDSDVLAAAFKDREKYEILSEHQLKQPISDDDYLQLGIAERDQLKYWKPQSIGEVIFNYWD